MLCYNQERNISSINKGDFMATMTLKTIVQCKCGKDMFPFQFDNKYQKIGYKCSDTACGAEMECSFDEVKVEEGERIHYFWLNDDGQMTWKCCCHGYCDFDVEWFMDDWQDKVDRFINLACALEKYPEEIDSDIERQEEHLAELKERLQELDEEQKLQLAEDMGIEIEDDYYMAFWNDFMERRQRNPFFHRKCFSPDRSGQLQFLKR